MVSGAEDNKMQIQTTFDTIDLQLTNKEVKELKDFMDNIAKYH
jgi:hypothetical protein